MEGGGNRVSNSQNAFNVVVLQNYKGNQEIFDGVIDIITPVRGVKDVLK